jgi:hypothetical protein
MRVVISLNIVHCSTEPDSVSTKNATKSIPDGISAASPIFSCYISQVEMRPYTCLRTAVKSAIGIVFNFPLQANRHAIVEWSYGGAMCYIRKRLSTVGHA